MCRLEDGGSGSGLGIENMRDVRSRAPPGDTARPPIVRNCDVLGEARCRGSVLVYFDEPERLSVMEISQLDLRQGTSFARGGGVEMRDMESAGDKPTALCLLVVRELREIKLC